MILITEIADTKKLILAAYGMIGGMTGLSMFEVMKLPLLFLTVLFFVNILLFAIYILGVRELKKKKEFIGIKSYLWKSIPIAAYIIGFSAGYLYIYSISSSRFT